MLNYFENIIAGIGEAFPNLKELFIGSNSIKFIERHDFADLSQLTILRLHMEQLEFLAYDVFYNLPDLESVSSYNGKLESLHENIFLNLRKLKTLVVIGHKIVALDENLFVNNPLLEEISFEKNELKVIKADFRKISNLTSISFFDNTCISDTFYKSYSGSTQSLEELQKKIDENCAK